MTYSQADIDLADSHVAQGERHVVQQEELIGRLRSSGLPTEAAEELLVLFRTTLNQHRTHRDYMLDSMAGSRSR